MNGIEARMIIDTGASRTSLTRSFAARAGIEPVKDDGSIAHTANGAIWVMGGRAKVISLGDARASNIPVFIQTVEQKGFGPGIDGLLGLSFLGNFKFTVNDGVLELQPLS
ncbi:retropepsin-like aspartic protease family protein [Parvibaculum sedimenti]|uniref:retropepsin-like aspartic protease family protein n=1 Tax=Parvibaculum sedimenti TaxID=2608632 RepID=UPI00248460C8|nr:retropepsin-like aspartic protease [Parvibaculum sedimenti]